MFVFVGVVRKRGRDDLARSPYGFFIVFEIGMGGLLIVEGDLGRFSYVFLFFLVLRLWAIFLGGALPPPDPPNLRWGAAGVMRFFYKKKTFIFN